MSSSPPRRRNAAATREAILQSAIGHFARAGYDGAGVREIARDAGVTAMLVNRYFGSKEQLFAEAVDISFTPPVFIADRPEVAGTWTAAALVARTNPDAEPPEPFLIMLRSLSNPRATEIVRDALERHVGRRLANRIPGPGGRLRGEVVLSLIAGTLLMRRVIGMPTLGEAQPQELQPLLEAVLAVIEETPTT
ncbi:TetR family transcriptional regulator [Nocardia sp. NPDC024068]|uniref:TetR/AcrR family transcriptional regulator n=1 Tax=Nocardia sp. NPDC024068 TaxID=3157197 RepID=UPI0033DA1183